MWGSRLDGLAFGRRRASRLGWLALVLSAHAIVSVACGAAPVETAPREPGGLEARVAAALPSSAAASEPSPTDPCVDPAAPDPESCLVRGRDAVQRGDATLAVGCLGRACRSPDVRFCVAPSTEPAPDSEAARALLVDACRACAEGEPRGCGFDPLLAAHVEAVAAACAEGRLRECDRLAWMRLYGCGLERDVAAVAAMAGTVSSDVMMALYSLDVELPPPPGLSPPPPAVEARLELAAREAPGAAARVGGLLDARGLPAISADGRVLALVDHAGAGTWEADSLVVLRASDGSRERAYPLASTSAEDDQDDAYWERHDREVRQNGARADRFLRRRGFRSLPRIPSFAEAPREGLPVVMDGRGGEVVLRNPGPGRVRFQAVLHPRFTPSASSTGDDEDAWCAVEGLSDVQAWMLPDGRVLVRSTVNPAPDECEVEHHYAIVPLH